MKIFDRIVEETEGKILPLGEDPTFKKRDYINMIKGCFIPRSSARPAGSFACPIAACDTADHCAMALSLDKDFRKKYDDAGVLVDDGNNHMWGVSIEGSHFALTECGHFYDPTDEYSFNGQVEMMDEGWDLKMKTPMATSWVIIGDPMVKRFGSSCCNLPEWMAKVKKTFDPNNSADPSGYLSIE